MRLHRPHRPHRPHRLHRAHRLHRLHRAHRLIGSIGSIGPIGSIGLHRLHRAHRLHRPDRLHRVHLLHRLHRLQRPRRLHRPGPMGTIGPIGFIGSIGSIGLIGSIAPSGSSAPTAPSDPAAPSAGSIGSSGLIGSIGPSGPIGPIGSIGFILAPAALRSTVRHEGGRICCVHFAPMFCFTLFGLVLMHSPLACDIASKCRTYGDPPPRNNRDYPRSKGFTFQTGFKRDSPRNKGFTFQTGFKQVITNQQEHIYQPMIVFWFGIPGVQSIEKMVTWGIPGLQPTGIEPPVDNCTFVRHPASSKFVANRALLAVLQLPPISNVGWQWQRPLFRLPWSSTSWVHLIILYTSQFSHRWDMCFFLSFHNV